MQAQPEKARPGKGKRKLGIALVIIVSVVALIAVNLLRQQAGAPAIAVDLTTVEPADFEVSIIANGVVMAGDRHEIAAVASGLVETVHVEEGDRVTIGDKLISLRTTELQRAVERAALQVQQAAARVTVLEQTEEAPRTIEAERQNLALARLSLADAEQALADATVYSPADGIVINVSPKPGQAVGMGAIVAVIGQLDPLEVEVHVDEVDVAGVRAGNEAEVTSAGLLHATFSGEVRRVALEAVVNSSGVATFPVTLDLANPGGELRPGMNVQVEIVTASRPAALTVPLVAVHERDDQQYVWVVRDGEATEVAVTTGLRSQSDAEITAGLAEGDRVISGPGSALRDMKEGTRVTGRGETR